MHRIENDPTSDNNLKLRDRSSFDIANFAKKF